MTKVTYAQADKWKKLAKKIINSKMSDELKVYTAYRWIAENIAYDKWYSDQVLKERAGKISSSKRREELYSSCNGTYDTKAGVCSDYSFIMAILCRTWKIPCVTVSNSIHMWNAVYLDGRWIELDVTNAAVYYVEDKELDAKRLKYDSVSYSNSFTLIGNDYLREVKGPYEINERDYIGDIVG